MVKAVSAATLTKDPTIRKVRIRGKVFTLQNLDRLVVCTRLKEFRTR